MRTEDKCGKGQGMVEVHNVVSASCQYVAHILVAIAPPQILTLFDKTKSLNEKS